MLVRIGQQGQIPCPLNGGRQLALVMRLGAGYSARDDFACFSDVITQGIEILVIDLLNTQRGESTEFPLSSWSLCH